MNASPPDPDLPDYERPVMPWEREAEIDLGRGMGSLGMEFALTILALAGLGYWADSSFDTSPWLLIVGTALGLTGGMVRLVRSANAINRRAEQSDARKNKRSP